MAPIILSMERNEKRVDIRFKKNIDFIDLYLDLMNFLDIGFDSQEYRDEKGNIDKQSLLREDEMDTHKSMKFNFEVFFGNKKILVVFESEEKLQQEFIDKISKNSQWKYSANN